MKKICFVTVDMTVIGGAETVAYEIAQALSDDYEVSVLGIQSKNEVLAYQFNEKITYHSLNVGNGRFRELLQSAYPKMKLYFKNHHFDVVFLEGTVAGFITIPHILRLRKTKFIFCDHGALINEWNDKEITLMRRLVSLCAKKTIVLTEKTYQDYLQRFHMKTKKICVIPNWISDKFKLVASPYNIESNRILSVGRFGKEKGYDMAIEVAKIVFDKHPDWKWDIYGDGETFLDIQKKIKDLHLDKQVILHGNVFDTSRLYANHALFVLPSYREGLPLVLLEAKINQLPCVSFDILTGPREIIRNNENGFLVPMYDIEKMAEKICFLIENKEERKLFAENALVDVEKFSKEKIKKQWIHLINSDGEKND